MFIRGWSCLRLEGILVKHINLTLIYLVFVYVKIYGLCFVVLVFKCCQLAETHS